MLKKGVNVDKSDDCGYTALMYASKLGFTEIVKILVDNFADVNKKQKTELTPLILASKYANGYDPQRAGNILS